MNSSGLPQQIPPQPVPFGRADENGYVVMDINWYLWLYNLALQVFSNSNGSLVVTPTDLLFIDGNIENAQSSIVGANTGSIDTDVVGADVSALNKALQALQLLMADVQDRSVDIVQQSAVAVNLAPYSNLTIPATYGAIFPDYYEIASGFYVDAIGVMQIE